MKRILLSVVFIFAVAAGAAVTYGVYITAKAVKANYHNWQQAQCLGMIETSLKGKDWELDTSGKKIKPISDMSKDDLLRVLFVYHNKLQQSQLALGYIKDMTDPYTPVNSNQLYGGCSLAPFQLFASSCASVPMTRTLISSSAAEPVALKLPTRQLVVPGLAKF